MHFRLMYNCIIWWAYYHISFNWLKLPAFYRIFLQLILNKSMLCFDYNSFTYYLNLYIIFDSVSVVYSILSLLQTTRTTWRHSLVTIPFQNGNTQYFVLEMTKTINRLISLICNQWSIHILLNPNHFKHSVFHLLTNFNCWLPDLLINLPLLSCTHLLTHSHYSWLNRLPNHWYTF